jgi:uncharacterized protein (DUF885 family)
MTFPRPLQIDRRSLLLSGAAGFAYGIGIRGARAQVPGGDNEQVADPGLRAFFDRMTEAMLERNPQQASFMGLDKGARAALKSRLNDRSWAAVERNRTADNTRLKDLKAIDPSTLNASDRVHYETVAYALELAAESSGFSYGESGLGAVMAEGAGPYVVNQQAGDFHSIPQFLANEHAIATKADADAYLERLEAFAECLDQETDRVRHDAGLGVIAPDFILDTALAQMHSFRAKPADQSRLVSSLTERLQAQAIAGDYQTQATRIVETKVYPAFDRQLLAVTALRARANDKAGVWKLPDGEAYYAWYLKCGTTTDMPAAEIHRQGLEQVAELGARMNGVLTQLGLSQGSIGQRLGALGKDPRYVFPNDDAGRAQLISYLNGRVAAVRARLPEAFDLRMKADVVIKRVPPEIQDGAPLGYESSGSIDGSRPSTYYINLKNTSTWPRFALPTLTYHETIPGHVWQVAYILENRSLPLIRSILSGFNAYVEGWALYAEQLADEIGMYDDDPVGRLGYLQAQRFRACRLVVDTGLHAMRWTRSQAINYLVETNGGEPLAMQSEVDRYCSGPGQACGYKVGHNEINRLRARAKGALGDRFRLQSFDDLVVKTASVPLTVLDGVVDRYIAGYGSMSAAQDTVLGPTNDLKKARQ